MWGKAPGIPFQSFTSSFQSHTLSFQTFTMEIVACEDPLPDMPWVLETSEELQSAWELEDGIEHIVMSSRPTFSKFVPVPKPILVSALHLCCKNNRLTHLKLPSVG